MPDGPRYDGDFYAWAQHQAKVLREMAAADSRFDRENVAEEFETLGRSERDAVRSQVCRIVEHLLKLAHSPAGPLRYGWMAPIGEARHALGDRLTPTLRREMAENLGRLYADGRHRADLRLRRHGEPAAADALPPPSPYTLDDVCREDWYPPRPGARP
jgi:hypothetical protein